MKDCSETEHSTTDKELAEMRETLGEILLALQYPLTPKERQNLWQYFELLLERYVEAQKKRPLQGVNPKMLSSGKYHMDSTGSPQG